MFTIAHAGGGIKNKKLTYLNSKEGFLMAYKRGVRLFEFDIMLTSDQDIVATHNFAEYTWSINNRKKLKEYKKANPTAISFRDILSLVKSYKDITILLDTKEMDYNTINIYEIVHNQITTRDDTLLNRFIPQIYNEATYKHIDAHCKFNQYIFATYKTDLTAKNIRAIVNKYPKIKAITAPANKLKSYKLSMFKGKKSVYFYTINNRFLRFMLKLFRVDGIYSDYLK